VSLVLITGPALEPVSLAEAKAHLRVDDSAEDALISSLIITSRLHIEAALSLALLTQTWAYWRDAWPARDSVELPLRPVQAITSVRTYAESGAASVLAPDIYALDGDRLTPRLLRRGLQTWPRPGRARSGIEITMVAGFGATTTDVPAPIRQALLLLAAHWYEHREPVEIGTSLTPIPNMVSELLAPYRWRRL
jgi:uncharacterized phiE125 gp8 family phage protein